MYEKERGRALVRAVELYYYEGMTQAAISDRLGCTRWTVGRLLKEASDKGIVTVSIRHPKSRSFQLEQQLSRTFGLRGARVTPTQPTKTENLTLVARTAADYLSDLRPRPQILGVACGRTTGAVARALPDEWTFGVGVTQLCSVPSEVEASLVGATVRIFAKRGHGTWKTVAGPVYAKTAEDAERLRNEPVMAEALALGAKSDLVIYSPGVANEKSPLAAYAHQTAEEISELQSRGAVAVLANHYIDSAGQPVDTDLDVRTIGIKLDELRKARNAIAVGCGIEKRAGFAALMAGGLASIVITDSETAEYLLDTAS